MTCIAKTLAATFVLVACGAAQAEAQAPASASRFYVEGAYAAVKYEGAGVSITPRFARGIVGYSLHPNVAVEGMLGVGGGDGTVTHDGLKLTGRIDSAYGLFVRTHLDLSPAFEAFARVGVARTRATIKSEDESLTGTDTAAAYGLGAAYKVAPAVAITGDFMNYYNKHGVHGNGFALGVRYSF